MHIGKCMNLSLPPAIVLFLLMMVADISYVWSADDKQDTNVIYKAGGWETECRDKDDVSTCHIRNNVDVTRKTDSDSKNFGKIIDVMFMYADAQKVDKASGETEVFKVALMKIYTPFGVSLKDGVVVQVDTFTEINLEYMQCVSRGCHVTSIVSDDFLLQMKYGKNMTVSFGVFGRGVPTVVSLPVDGFKEQFEELGRMIIEQK